MPEWNSIYSIGPWMRNLILENFHFWLSSIFDDLGSKKWDYRILTLGWLWLDSDTQIRILRVLLDMDMIRPMWVIGWFLEVPNWFLILLAWVNSYVFHGAQIKETSYSCSEYSIVSETSSIIDFRMRFVCMGFKWIPRVFWWF